VFDFATPVSASHIPESGRLDLLALIPVQHATPMSPQPRMLRTLSNNEEVPQRMQRSPSTTYLLLLIKRCSTLYAHGLRLAVSFVYCGHRLNGKLHPGALRSDHDIILAIKTSCGAGAQPKYKIALRPPSVWEQTWILSEIMAYCPPYCVAIAST
jgi:hypothetical protein